MESFQELQKCIQKSLNIQKLPGKREAIGDDPLGRRGSASVLGCPFTHTASATQTTITTCTIEQCSVMCSTSQVKKIPIFDPRPKNPSAIIVAKIGTIYEVGETTWSAKLGKNWFRGRVTPFGWNMRVTISLTRIQPTPGQRTPFHRVWEGPL